LDFRTEKPMKKYTIITAFFILMLFNYSVVVSAQKNDPAVREACIPFYPATAVISNQQGKVFVDVEIRKDGSVESIKIKQGHPLFEPVLKLTVSKWRFETTKSRKKRTVQLCFIFVLVPSETESVEMLSIYRSPYEVEIKARYAIAN
jgi:TonB family protein